MRRYEGLIGGCEYCGNPIYKGDSYIEDADGNMYCNENCLNEAKRVVENNEEYLEEAEKNSRQTEIMS